MIRPAGERHRTSEWTAGDARVNDVGRPAPGACTRPRPAEPAGPTPGQVQPSWTGLAQLDPQVGSPGGPDGRQRPGQPLRCLTASASCGATVNRSPTTPKSAISKIGASA